MTTESHPAPPFVDDLVIVSFGLMAISERKSVIWIKSQLYEKNLKSGGKNKCREEPGRCGSLVRCSTQLEARFVDEVDGSPLPGLD